MRRQPGRDSARLIVIVVAVAVVTIAVPPLIAPHDPDPVAGGPVTSTSTPPADTGPATGRPSVPPPSAPPPSVPPPSAPPPSAPPGSRAPGATVPACAPATEASSRPSCGVYTTSLGTGWTIEGTGVRFLPAGVVPGTGQVAIRVEPQPDSRLNAVALVADSPVRAPPLLRLRVFGGRVHGSVLRLSASPSAQPDRARSVTLTAPVDRWSTFTVRLAELLPAGSPVRRIDLTVASELVPDAYRFFVDDVEFLDP